MTSVVLLTGDGDFEDLALLFKDHMMINFYIVGFRKSMNIDLIGAVGDENVIYLDDVGFISDKLVIPGRKMPNEEKKLPDDSKSTSSSKNTFESFEVEIMSEKSNFG